MSIPGAIRSPSGGRFHFLVNGRMCLSEAAKSHCYSYRNDVIGSTRELGQHRVDRIHRNHRFFSRQQFAPVGWSKGMIDTEGGTTCQP